MEWLRQIEHLRLVIDIEAAARTASVLSEILDRIGDEEGLPSIYSFTTPVDAEVTIETITPSHFDRSVVAPLLAVASKERPADSLIQPPESKPALALDPATIKQTIAVDSRGVQAILKWISEGGGNPEFVKLINRIIVEDGGVGPLVEGLVKVAAVLGYMAGAVLGTSAEGVIAGMMEAYTQFEWDLGDDDDGD